jgi:hypothetical protein
VDLYRNHFYIYLILIKKIIKKIDD